MKYGHVLTSRGVLWSPTLTLLDTLSYWWEWFFAFPQTGYLAMLCYNFGLDVFQKGEYRHSVTWLKWVAIHSMFPIQLLHTARAIANNHDVASDYRIWNADQIEISQQWKFVREYLL